MTGVLRRCYGQAWLLLSATTLLWAGNAVAGRAVAVQMSPMAVVTLRWLAVCVVLGVVLRTDLRSGIRALLPHRRLVALMGAGGFTAFNALFYVAAYRTTAVNMTLLQTCIPVFVLAGAVLLRVAAVTLLPLCGMAATMAGVAIVAARGEPSNLLALSFNSGDLMLIVACLLYAAYTLALRRRPAVPALVFFAAMALAAMLSSLPLLLAEVLAGQTYWPSPKGWAILVFISLGPSLLAQIFYMRGVELIGPGRAGLFANLVPVFGSVLAVVLLGEDFHVYHAIALVLGLGGIWLSEMGARPAVAA